MEGFILRFVQDVKHKESVVIPGGNQTDFLLLYGLVQRVRRLVKAFMLLRRKGFESEGELLVRAALEHSVTAQWAYLTPGGVERLNKTMAKAQHDLAKGMLPYSSAPGWVEAERQASESVPDGKGLPKFTGPQGILSEVDQTHFLRATYRVLSQVGHVTHETQLDFVSVDENSVVHLLGEPSRASFEAELLYSMTGFSMLASWVLARLEADSAELIKLRGLAVDLKVPYRLDLHMDSSRRRFPEENM